MRVDIKPALALGVGKNSSKGAAFASGSAILLNSQLALCARHVLEDYWQKAEYRSLAQGENTPSFQIVAAGGFGSDALGCQWDVVKVWMTANTDIAVIALTQREGTPAGWVYPVIDLAPPSIGESVVACGFAQSTVEWSEEKAAFIWRDQPIVSLGVVTAVHHKKRDSAFLDFPCFEFEGRVDPGMSGGPIFNAEGRLCGVVSSGDDGNSGGGYQSAGALVWASMAIDLDGSLFGKGEQPYPLLRAAIEEQIGVVGLHRIQTEHREDGSISSLSLVVEPRETLF